MSGPKVVNIQALRRQQRRESAARLRELNAMIEECLGLQNANPSATTEFRHQTEVLLTRLNRLREGEQWGDLVAETTSYCNFYQQEAADLRHRAVERRTTALRREHHLRQSATQLADALRKLPPSSERDNALHQLAAAEGNEEGFAAAIAEAAEFVAMTHRVIAVTENAKRLQRLAATYADPEASGKARTLPSVAKDPDELRLDRCWSLLGELEVHDPKASIEAWRQKARATATAASNERALMLDSLVLELTTHVRAQRAHNAAKAAVEAVLSEIETLSSSEAVDWRTKLRAVLEQSLLTAESQELAESARAWLAQENAHEDAREQRVAVLRALSELGYEVREGMIAAWTEQGRVVVHKPNEPFYGVELSAPATGNAFQTRVVAAGEQPRTNQRDREVEERWCSEFARLRALLAEDGFQTNLAQAHEPGTIPIKTFSKAGDAALRGRALEMLTHSKRAEK